VPIFFVLVGALFIAAGVNGKGSDLVTLVKGDFIPTSGNSGGFGAWALAIFVIGALGYFKPIKPISNAFLVLVIVVLFLAAGNPKGNSGGLFNQINAALRGVNPADTVAGVAANQVTA
jgi:hypothetical protein